MLSRLDKPRRRVVGLKQTLKTITKGTAECVFLACDADPPIKLQVEEACREYSIPLKLVDSRTQLGEACGIDVGAATAALLKEDKDN